MVISGGGISKRSSRATGSVVAESRMRSAEQVKGGGGGGGVKVIKDINGGSENLESDDKAEIRSPGSAVKRRTCKSESNSVNLPQLQKRKSCGGGRNVNGNCKSPVGSQRKRLMKAVVVVEDSRSDRRLRKEEELLEVDGSDRRNSGEVIEKGLAQLDTEKARSDEDKDDDEQQEEEEEEEEVEEVEDDHDESGEDEEERMDEEIEVEKNMSCDEEIVVEKNISDDDEVVVEESISDCDDKEMNAMQVNNSVSNCNSKFDSLEPKLSPLKPTIAKSSNAAELSPVKKQSPKFTRPIHSSPIRNSYPDQRVPETHSKLQSLVDLVMWKYVPRSTLVFGVGTFLIISSSYTTDLNISFISVVSYLGLVYLGISFLYKSFRCRNVVDGNDTSYCHGMVVIGEEEAIWLARMILPCLNEFLLKLKALFTGDPAVTMKLAAVLFALARCGSCITVWKMVKLGFFAVFILPKFCSSYSAQISGYGKFWFLRFQDAWRSCSHKKVVGFAMFTIVWNLSSVVARIWAAFMLFVAVRYYQQSTIKAETWGDVEVETGGTSNDNHVLQRRPLVMKQMRQGRPSARPIPGTPVDLKAAKKAS